MFAAYVTDMTAFISCNLTIENKVNELGALVIHCCLRFCVFFFSVTNTFCFLFFQCSSLFIIEFYGAFFVENRYVDIFMGKSRQSGSVWNRRNLKKKMIHQSKKETRRRLVHTMPDKFENATLLLRLSLPSTLQRTYPHKKIRENGTF